MFKGPNSGEKSLYLTFDDGPEPGITDEILKILDDFGAKATFFCLGKNIEEHPQLSKEILRRGHKVGNHTYGHLDSWRTSVEEYLEDVSRADEVIRWNLGIKTRLFRAPYGRLRLGAWRQLRKRFKVIGWEVMPGDFDPSVSKEQCLKNVLQHTADQSIIVLHDNPKSWEKVQYLLPLFLQHFSEQGYQFKTLGSQRTPQYLTPQSPPIEKVRSNEIA